MAAPWNESVAPNPGVGTTRTAAIVGSPAAGDLIVVGVTQIYGGNPPRSISAVDDNIDGVGAPYVLAKSKHDAGGEYYIDIYYHVVVTGGARTVTAHFTGGSADANIAVNWGSNAYTVLDATNSNNGTATPMTPGSVSPSAAARYFEVSTNVNGVTVATPASFTESQYTQSSGTCPIKAVGADLTGAQNPSSALGGSGKWGAAIVTFIAAAGGGLVIPVAMAQYRQRWS